MKQYRITAHFWGANFDENTRRAETGVRVAWVTGDNAIVAADAYARALIPVDRDALHAVHVVTVIPAPHLVVDPALADVTFARDNRVIAHPTTGATFVEGPDFAFHWIVTSTTGAADNGCMGEMRGMDVPITSMSDQAALAWCVLEAARVHNASYVAGESEADIATHGHHAVSIDAAAKQFGRDSNEAGLIALLLFTAWNDACDWAQQVIERRTDHPGDTRWDEVPFEKTLL